MGDSKILRFAALCLMVAAGSAFANPEEHAPVKPRSLAEPLAKKPEAPKAKPEPKKAEAPDEHAPATVVEVKPVAEEASPADADGALRMLREGNARWVGQKATGPNTDSSRRQEVAEGGQHPFVTVLTCADSRLPVERIFDRGVGEIFVVRVAGNIAGPSETGTIEYGLEHLHTPVLVVMGHTKCGAVAAAASGKELPGALGTLVHAIDPAIERTRRQNPGVDEKQLAALGVRENVWQSIFDLCRRSETTRTLVREGKVRVVGAICDITTGKVEWLGEHPWQAQLLDAIDARHEASADAKGE